MNVEVIIIDQNFQYLVSNSIDKQPVKLVSRKYHFTSTYITLLLRDYSCNLMNESLVLCKVILCSSVPYKKLATSDGTSF